MIFLALKQGIKLMVFRRFFPRLDRFIQLHLMDVFAPKRHQNQQLTNSRVAKRMALQTDRPDFMHAMLGKNTDGKEVSLVTDDNIHYEEETRSLTLFVEVITGPDPVERIPADRSRFGDDGDGVVRRHLPSLQKPGLAGQADCRGAISLLVRGRDHAVERAEAQVYACCS